MYLTSLMTTGVGISMRSERTGRARSTSSASAFWSMISRMARRTGTIVSGSNDALSARQPIAALLITVPDGRNSSVMPARSQAWLQAVESG